MQQQKIRHGFVIEAGDGLDLTEKVRAFVDDCMQEGMGNSAYIRIVVKGAKLPEDSEMISYSHDTERLIGNQWDETRELEIYTKSYIGFSYNKSDRNKLEWYDVSHMNVVRSNLKDVLRNELPPKNVGDNRSSMIKAVDNKISTAIPSFLMDLERRRYGIYAYYDILDMIRNGATAELQVNIKRPDTRMATHEIAIHAKGSSGQGMNSRKASSPDNLEMGPERLAS